MSAKTTKKRYTASEAIKGGSATSIYSACNKTFLSEKYVDLRDKHKHLKSQNRELNNEYDKLKVKSEQMDQYVVENKKLIAKNQQQHTDIIQLTSQIKLLKETTNDRGDYQRLEGIIKKKVHEIEELKKQIDSTKINQIEHLKNTIKQQNEQIQYLKEGYGKFNVVDVSLKEENEGLKAKLDDVKEEIEELKFNLGGMTCDRDAKEEEIDKLIQKLDEYRKISTQLFDLG